MEHVKERKDLTDEERLHLFMLLVKEFNGKKLAHGAIKKYANLYSVSCRTVSRLWALGSKFLETGDLLDVKKKLSNHVGRRKIQLDIEKIKEIPLRRRKTLASLAHALEISKSTVQRRFKDGVIRRHSDAVKPHLTDENKKARLQFCLSMINVQREFEESSLSSCGITSFGNTNIFSTASSSNNQKLASTFGQQELEESSLSSCGTTSFGNTIFVAPSTASSSENQADINGRSVLKFKEMFDYIVIDEKWFYMSKETEKYYLTVDEEEPYRSCKSKKFITKVMFLAAVARPRFDDLGGVVFDGKIGIFPFTYQEPAKRKSKNRAAGTLETKTILAVNQDVSRSWMLEKVLPAIRDKWPKSSRRSTIFIQQDNARPHIKPLDEKFIHAARIDGFDIQLTCQPPNSPNLNVLDLGYFRAIQSLQYQEAPKNIDELVAAVKRSFNELSPNSLNRVFLTLQACMMEVMKCGGDNNFKMPHLSKEKLERQGRLPLSLSCPYEVLQKANDHLHPAASKSDFSSSVNL